MARPTENTVGDLYCGAGGSSIGAEMAGAEVVFALNHSPLAVRVHNMNHPNADHLRVDAQRMTDYQIRRTPDSAILVAGAPCPNHSLAKGARSRKQKSAPLFDEAGKPTDATRPLAEGVEERSRATLNEICRFVEQKQLKGKPYLAVIVENVPQCVNWGIDNDGRHFRRWLNRILRAGYDHEILWINSMLIPPEPGVPMIPQSRDRMYCVFWMRGLRRPDLKLQPTCWCPRCETLVAGEQVFKRADRPPWGSYGSQYYYACPACYSTAIPAAPPAASIIDYSVPITRIGDRERPLKPATRDRIRRGLTRLTTEPFAIKIKQNREPNPLTLPLVDPLAPLPHDNGSPEKDQSLVMANTETGVPRDAERSAAQTIRTAGGLSLVTRTGHKSANGNLCRNGESSPAFGITTAGDLALVMANRIHGVPRDAATSPAQTVCTGETLGVVELQRNGSVRHESSPVHTVRSGGNHHGILVSNYTPGWSRDPETEPFGSVTTTDGHSLLVPYSTNGRCPVPTREPAPTITTLEKLSLVIPYYRTGKATVSEKDSAPTVTTRDRLSLLVPPTAPLENPVEQPLPPPTIGEEEIDDSYFRMFTVEELARAQALALRADGTPFVLEGTRADKTRMIGNANNPPVIRHIILRLLDAIDAPANAA